MAGPAGRKRTGGLVRRRAPRQRRAPPLGCWLLRCADVTRQLATCMVDSTAGPSIIPAPPHLGCSGEGPWHYSRLHKATWRPNTPIWNYFMSQSAPLNPRWRGISVHIFSNRMESMAGFHPASRSGKSSALRSVDSRCELCSQAFVFDTPFAAQKSNSYEFRTRISGL